MRSRQTPSKDIFILRMEETAALQLEPLGVIEPAEGGFLIRLRSPLGESKAAWERLQREAGDSRVDPVLFDETGKPHYPTGTITVRYNRTPSPKFLENFAARYGLAATTHDQGPRTQVTFRVASPRFLPELVEALESAKAVTSVWADTKTRYRRAAPASTD